MKIKHVVLGIVLGAAVIVSSIIGGMVYADEAPISEMQPDNKLYVSPSITRIEDYLKPGDSFTRTLTLYNSSSEGRFFRVTVEPMGVKSDNQNYDITWGVSPTQYNKIVGWTTLSIEQDEEIWIESKSKMPFTFTVDVPKNATGGAQYMSIIIHLISPEDVGEGSWGVKTVLNTLVYTNVDGDVDVCANVLNQNIKGFSFQPVINTSSTVEDCGNVDILAKYRLEVKDLWGKALWAEETERVIVPDNRRYLAMEWNEAPRFGIFKVTTTIALADGDHVAEATVFIVPVWLVIILVAFILTAIASIIVGHKKRMASKVR